MVQARSAVSKEKALAEMRQISAVRFLLTCGHQSTWVPTLVSLAIMLLGVQYFPLAYTAAKISEAVANVTTEWGITEKLCGMVTDGAHNFVASVSQFNRRLLIALPTC